MTFIEQATAVLEKSDVPTVFAYANRLCAQGNLREAEVIYKQLVISAPGFLEIYYNLGSVLQAQGKTDEAISTYQAAFRFFISGRSKENTCRRHTTLKEWTVGGFNVCQIAPSVSIRMFNTDNTEGYHAFGNDWWTNLKCPHAYQYYDMDDAYPEPYFSACQGHPDEQAAEDIYWTIRQTYGRLFGRDFSSVLEIGAGGGEISAMFHKYNHDLTVVEGTTAGCAHIIGRGIARERVIQMDIKRFQPLGRRFDLVICTEVAEHLEPFFASKVAEMCIAHGDAVWFSAADRERRAHYHHINELPIAAWDNLFAYMGYNTFVELNLENRGTRLYLSDACRENLAASALPRHQE